MLDAVPNNDISSDENLSSDEDRDGERGTTKIETNTIIRNH